MEGTNEFRWLQFRLGDTDERHPTARIIDGTNYAIVLQQKWVESYAFNGGPVPDGKHEWRDIPIV